MRVLEDLFEDYLFAKGYLVSTPDQDHSSEAAFSTLIGLGNTFGIVITKQANLADVEMLHVAERNIGYNVPAPFYQGFPHSVKELSVEERLIDQLYSYFVTYGLNDFEGEGTRSIFEEQVKREVLDEHTDPRYFEILTEQQALEKLADYVDDLLLSTRPLNTTQYALVKTWVNTRMDLNARPSKIASKNTAIRLLIDTRLMLFAERFLALPDTIKIVEELLNSHYPDQEINKLNLTNKDRKFIKCIISALARKSTETQMRECLEKRKLWKGLLHHLHLIPRNQAEQTFIKMIFDDNCRSSLSSVEYLISTGKVRQACDTLRNTKGATAVLRNMNYLLSRCTDPKDKDYIIDKAFETSTALPLIQQLFTYKNYQTDPCALRTFKFTKHNLLRSHKETYCEARHRKSRLTSADAARIATALEVKIQQMLKGRLGKVYIDPATVSRAVPLQEAASNGGYGVLPRGSRIALDGRTVRLFTYWERVNDIDISAIGIDRQGEKTEFSWRTFASRSNQAICFSGDQTRGYEGGSEYIDVDIPAFKALYPNLKYLVVCDNVYSGIPFDNCLCTAGYMLREKVDSGEVFEPKTVKSSFLVKGQSIFAYLFAIDLDTNEFVWLNVVNDSQERIAGSADLDFLFPYLETIDTFNMLKLFTYLATEVVDDPQQADVIVTDDPKQIVEEQQQVIHSNDTETIMKLMQ